MNDLIEVIPMITAFNSGVSIANAQSCSRSARENRTRLFRSRIH